MAWNRAFCSVVWAWFIVLFFLPATAWAFPEQTAQLRLPFFGDTLEVDYETELFSREALACEDAVMRERYRHLEQFYRGTFLASLTQIRSDHQLNDWLSYQLLRRALTLILPDAGKTQRNFLEWYFLGKLGFDSRLACLRSESYLYIYTRDTIYGRSFLKIGNREFINLDRPGNPLTGNDSLFLFSLDPWENTRAFSFDLNPLPKLRENPIDRTLSFRYKGDTLAVTTRLDQTLCDIMDGYPRLQEAEYLHTPLSGLAEKSLLPAMRDLIRGKSRTEALELLVAFTRTAFIYREDEGTFGWSKPMIAEETLLFPGSDCEDRCAIFYQLVRKLLDLPMIVLAYPEHMTIAVALEEEIGPAISYKGRNYYVCDPTGPANDEGIGRLPEKYDQLPFEIIGE